MSYYKDRLGFDPDEPTANGDGTTFRKSKRGYEENLCKFKGICSIIFYCYVFKSCRYSMRNRFIKTQKRVAVDWRYYNKNIVTPRGLQVVYPVFKGYFTDNFRTETTTFKFNNI